MRDTQATAYQEIRETLPEKRRIVLNAIDTLGLATLIEIANWLGWPINSVSGRVTELAKDGLIEDSGQRATNPSGKKAILWKKVGGEI